MIPIITQKFYVHIQIMSLVQACLEYIYKINVLKGSVEFIFTVKGVPGCKKCKKMACLYSNCPT